ncbi:MAG: hypothetical protein AAF368_05360 [Planctomycetota bacterium]
MAAGAMIFEGAHVCKNPAGFLVPASEAPNLKYVGRAEATRDNQLGQDGDLTCPVRSDGAFEALNGSGADEILKTHIGNQVFFSDDETVNLTDNTGARSASAKLYDVRFGRPFVTVEN